MLVECSVKENIDVPSAQYYDVVGLGNCVWSAYYSVVLVRSTPFN